MLHLSASCQYYLHRHATDMRKGFDSLCGIVTSQLKMDVLNGSVFIFINKKHNQVKLLLWEGDGFSVYYKRLEKGTFEMPQYDSCNHTMIVTDNELTFILKGVALKKIKYRPRYSHTMVVC